MKKQLLILFVLFSLPCLAQTFTNANVYDFAVGDVYQKYRNDVYNPPFSSCSTHTYQTDSILLKYYSAGLDTVFYVVQTDTYKPWVCPSFSGPAFSSYIHTDHYTNLNDTVLHFVPMASCAPYSDTIILGSGSCNDIWKRTGHTDGPTCFEEPYYTSQFILGAGGPYVNLQDPHFAGQMYYEYLIYYRKGTSSCGTYYHMPGPMGVEEYEGSSILLYPNPANNILQLIGIENNCSYTITDIAGRKIMDGMVAEYKIDIAALSKGGYFITLTSNKGRLITKQIIKN